MSNTADHLEREIETHRANVENSLDKLRGRMSVDKVVNNIGQFMGLEDVRGTLAKAGQQVRENPVALGLIGIGVIWLVMGRSQAAQGAAESHGSRSYTPYSGASPASGQQAGPDRRRAEREGETFLDKVADQAAGAKEMAGDVAHDLADKVNQTTSGLTDSVKNLASAVADRLHARDVIAPITQRLEQQPLLLGGVALISGAVIGAALPRTQTEDRLLATPRNRLIQEAQEAARGLKERATGAAQRTLDTAVQTAISEGLLPDGETTIAERVENVATAAIGEARDQIDPVLHGSNEKRGTSEGTGVQPNRGVRNPK